MRRVAGVLLVLMLCNTCRNEKKITPDVTQELHRDSVVHATQTYGRYVGLFVVGRNSLSFRECENHDQLFAVVDSTGQMAELYSTVFLQTPAFPYEYVYVEVEGETQPPGEHLLARGYDSVLIVRRIQTFEQKNYQNSCVPYDFWVLGENWSLQISREEEIIVLKDFTSRQVFVFEYFAPRASGEEQFVYASNNYATQASIKVTISREDCDGKDSEFAFEYSASALVNGKRFGGCAIRGDGAIH